MIFGELKAAVAAFYVSDVHAAAMSLLSVKASVAEAFEPFRGDPVNARRLGMRVRLVPAQPLLGFAVLAQSLCCGMRVRDVLASGDDLCVPLG